MSDINRLKSILSRYKLASQILDYDDIILGGGHNIKYLLRYYIYFPVSIGLVILTIGFLVDFVLFKFSCLPFLLYALYGLVQIKYAMNENLNTITIKNGEIRVSQNKIDTLLKSNNVKDYIVESGLIEGNMFEGQLFVADMENKKHFIVKLIDDDITILEDNLDYLNKFIQLKMNHNRSSIN